MNYSAAKTQVFVYGTLKPKYHNYVTYCQGKTIAEIPAYTKGTLYHLPMGYPAMTKGSNLSEAKALGDRVEGYLLSFNSEDILVALDALEGYSPTRDNDLNHYYRQKIPVYSLSDEFLGEAWGYLMREVKVKEYGGKLFPFNSWYLN